MPVITDWLMVIITAIYVIATILICWANFRAAKATREQVAESKRQYEEEHRAYVTYQLIFEQRMWYGIRFTNHGKRVANHVRFRFESEFVNSLPQRSFVERTKDLEKKELVLGVEQSYDFYFGSSDFRDNPNKKPIMGTISYCDSVNSYTEDFCIDFEKYATIFSVQSDAENLLEAVKRQSNYSKEIAVELKKLRVSLERLPEVYESEIIKKDVE